MPHRAPTPHPSGTDTQRCSHVPVCSPGSLWGRVWSRTTQSQRRRSVCSLRTCRDRQPCSERSAAPVHRRHIANLLLPRASHPRLESSAEILTRKLAVLTAPRSFCFMWGKQSRAAPPLSPTAHRVVGLQDAASTRASASSSSQCCQVPGGELLREPTAHSCAPVYPGKGNWSKLLQSAGRPRPSVQHSRLLSAQHRAGRTQGQCWAGRTHACPAAVPQPGAPGARWLHRVQPCLRAAPRTAHPAAPPTQEAAVKRCCACRTAPAPSSLPYTQCHPAAPRLPGRLPPAPAAAQHGCTRLLLPRPGPAPSAAKRAAKPLIHPSAISSTAEPRLCARSRAPRCPAATGAVPSRPVPAAQRTQLRHSGASSSLQPHAQQKAAALPRGRQQGLARCPAGVGRKARETRIYRQQNEQRS